MKAVQETTSTPLDLQLLVLVTSPNLFVHKTFEKAVSPDPQDPKIRFLLPDFCKHCLDQTFEKHGESRKKPESLLFSRFGFSELLLKSHEANDFPGEQKAPSLKKDQKPNDEVCSCWS